MTSRNLSRRAILALGAAAAGALVLALPHGALAQNAMYEAAKAEGELVLYTDIQVEVVQGLIDGFTAKYPGIEVNFFRGDTGQVMQRFETESAAGRHEADLVTTTDRQSKLLYAKGYTAPYKSIHIDRYPGEIHGKDYAWSTYGTVQLGFAWNTDQVSASDVPDSWQDFLDPKWKGRLGMQDPLQGGGAGIWVATMYGLWGEDEWSAFMQKLGGQNIRYGRYLEVREMVASGEVDAQLVAYPAFTQPVIDKGAPVKWKLIEPALFTGLTLNLSANAPHPNAAKLYIDYVLSDEGQQIFAEKQQIPALPEKIPAVYSSITEVKLTPQAHELEAEKFDFFQAKMKEFFVR